MNNKDLAKNVLDLVGGEQNISGLTHCATRLRFVLKDDNKADLKALDQARRRAQGTKFRWTGSGCYRC